MTRPLLTNTDKKIKSIQKILIIQHKLFRNILLNLKYLPGLIKKFITDQIGFLVYKN